MPFTKGKSGNPSGRPAGTPNKSTNELRDKISAFLDENWETLNDDFQDLEPKERLDFLEKMLRHVLPRPLHPLETLSDEDLRRMLEMIKSNEL